MACSCKGNHIQMPVDGVPHKTAPTEACIFCAEKHISTAYAYIRNMGRTLCARQLVLGELELARRHVAVAYKDIAGLLAVCIHQILCRKATGEDVLLPVVSAVDAKARELKDGKDPSDAPLYDLVSDISAPNITPLLGELHFCAAWRLAFECGYESPNRQTIIGDLALAQTYLYRFSYKLAEDLRDMRHMVQRSEEALLNSKWIQIAQNMGAAMDDSMQEIEDKYGTDISWYLNPSVKELE